MQYMRFFAVREDVNEQDFVAQRMVTVVVLVHIPLRGYVVELARPQ